MVVRWLFCLTLCVPTAAQAYCQEPSFPYATPNAPRKPDEPFCVGWKNCTELDVLMYQRELEYWTEALQRYVKDAQEVADEYVESVLEFAKCELRNK